MNTKFIRIIFVILILYFIYLAGFPIYYIPLIGILFILLILIKGTFYSKIDDFLTKKFPFTGRLPPWAKKILIIVIFIFVYTLVKQIVFIILKALGIDIQQMILESMNMSINK